MVVAAPIVQDDTPGLCIAEPRVTHFRPSDFQLGVLFERALDAVVVADLDSGRIVLWNPAAERLFGYTAEDALGQPIEMLMDEGIGTVHHAGLERYRRSGHGLIIDSGKSVEVPGRTRLGQDIRVELTLSPVECVREGAFVLGLLRDVTDRKRVELLQFELNRVHHAREAAEAAIVARDEFLANVATEHGCEKLERISRALVDLKLIDAGKLPLHVENDVDVVHIVRQAVSGARARAAAHRITIRGASCVLVGCDPVRIAEVVDHLLDNAITHNPHGCAIEVRFGRPARALVEISVRDFGVGVPPDRRAGLFERFYHGHPNDAGAGLGLHLSQKLVELHGGSLEAVFPPTGGMRVVVTLPIIASA